MVTKAQINDDYLPIPTVQIMTVIDKLRPPPPANR